MYLFTFDGDLLLNIIFFGVLLFKLWSKIDSSTEDVRTFFYSSFSLMNFLRLNKLHLMMKIHLLTSWMLVALRFYLWHIFFHIFLMDFLLLLMMKIHLLTSWIVVALDFDLWLFVYSPFFLMNFVRFDKLLPEMMKMRRLTCWMHIALAFDL